MKVIASYNIKGGVGKTAIAVSLADAAVQAGYRTLLWDLDEQGGAGAILGRAFQITPAKPRRTYRLTDHIEPSAWPGLDLLPADRLQHVYDRHDRPGHLHGLLGRIAGDYDRVILDCPPTLGGLAEQVFALSDLIVVPIIPSSLSINAFEQLNAYREAVSGRKPKLLPVFSMVDKRRRAHKDALNQHPDRLGIPYASAVERMAEHRAPMSISAPSSPAAQPLAELWQRVEESLA